MSRKPTGAAVTGPRYSGATGVWKRPTQDGWNSLPPRLCSAVASLPSESAIAVYGGISTEGVLGDLWMWDGSSWGRVSPSLSPPARADCMLAECGPGNELLLYGGVGAQGGNGSASQLGDTWLWDGSSWSLLGGTGPPARCAGAMAFDGVREQVVLFGGLGGDLDAPYPGDTWVWADGVWVERARALSPAGRVGAAIAFDRSLRRLLLFGGSLGALFGDTWSWDGGTWRPVQTPHSPPPRTYAGMVFHEGIGATVLFGGVGAPSQTGSAALSDSWAFDGSDWSPLDTGPVAPPGGDSRTLIYSAALGGALLLHTAVEKTRDPASGHVVALPPRLSAWVL